MGKRNSKLVGQDVDDGRGQDARALIIVGLPVKDFALIEDDVDPASHNCSQVFERDGARGTPGATAHDGHGLAVLQSTQTRYGLVHGAGSRVSSGRAWALSRAWVRLL
jgi:hypothetical protein